jgi:hypothetical protein
MTIITAILDFLLMTWVFWPIILTLPFVAYYNVVSAVKDDESEIFSGFLIAAIVGILAYKFPAFRGYFDGWRAVAVVAGGYVAAGFLLSLYKWFVVLWDFRKADPKSVVESCRKEYAHREEERETGKLSGSYYNIPVKERIKERPEFNKCIVETSDDTFMIYPNWKKYPIGTWWVYWPFFLLELPFDFIKRVMENVFKWLKHFYNGIAQKFAVTA